jgi:hypothetical protein
MRKASDILLSIEAKLEEILALVKSHDFQLKTLMNRKAQSVPPAQIPGLKPGVMPGLKPGVKLGPQSEEYNFPQLDDDLPKGKRRDLRYVNNSQPISVQQRIVGMDGKPVASARVEIYTKSPGTNSLVLIDNKRTNAAGKWTGSLVPGEYLIKAFKKGPTHDLTLNSEMTIVITEDTDQQLPHLMP